MGIDLSRLEGSISLSNLGRGTQLFVAGDACDRLFLLNSGRVKICVVGPGGRHCLFHIVEPGEIFGEAALLGERTWQSSAEVLERASITMAPVRSAERHARRHPEFWTSFAPLLLKRMRYLEQQVQWVSFLEVEQRIARLMLRWAESHGLQDGGLELHLSQRDLAGMVGATRETTSSALNRLQRDGCIQIRRRHVSLLSIARLRERAGASTLDSAESRDVPNLVRVTSAGE